MDNLTPGQRVILSLWRDSHRALVRDPAGRVVAEAAAHALLARLRDACPTVAALWHHYEGGSDADFALIASLVPSPMGALTQTDRERALYPIREAAFWLRWREFTGEGP